MNTELPKLTIGDGYTVFGMCSYGFPYHDWVRFTDKPELRTQNNRGQAVYCPCRRWKYCKSDEKALWITDKDVVAIFHGWTVLDTEILNRKVCNVSNPSGLVFNYKYPPRDSRYVFDAFDSTDLLPDYCSPEFSRILRSRTF